MVLQAQSFHELVQYLTVFLLTEGNLGCELALHAK